MRTYFWRFLFLFFLLVSHAFTLHATDYAQSVKSQADELLQAWCDALLDYQVDHAHPGLQGGLLCPACGRMHGRSGDAVLPLMYMAEHTGDMKYRDGALRLMKWMDNVHQADGCWMNDIHVSNWNGTTVFQAIALYEAYHYQSHLLTDSVKATWRSHLLGAAEFIAANPFIYSRKREGMRNMNINYSASAPYVLHVVGVMHDRPDFIALAKEIATGVKAYFTENDGFLFGEGPEIYKKSANGCMPVDLLYNVEESLPNLLSYAQLVNDDELVDLIERSMQTHLEFMLPDGAWDNSWGTRSFKWTYWGGRTSDGFMGGYHALVARNPVFLSAIERNIAVLKAATHEGLLYGGMHYRSANEKACIHHTFGHAKALAAYLNQDIVSVSPTSLPRDAAYGVKFFKDINTYLVAQGPWRATITGFDAEYKTKGTHPMGGVMSLLWHEVAGPLFASTTNRYHLIESPNMQSIYNPDYQPGSVALVYTEDGVRYSNLDDLDFQLKWVSSKRKRHAFEAKVHLVDYNQAKQVEETATLRYEISDRCVTIVAKLPDALVAKGAALVLPLLADYEAIVEATSGGYRVQKPNCQIRVQTEQKLELPISLSERIFNPVPGFCYLPILIYPNHAGELRVDLTID